MRKRQDRGSASETMEGLRSLGRTEGMLVDGRRRLALGAAATVTASIGLMVAVAMSGAVALDDVSGEAVGHGGVVVPRATADPLAPEASETPVPATTEAAPAAAPERSSGTSETVPAPAPIEVATVPAVDDLAEWDAATLRAWAEDHDWSDARTERWIAGIDRLRGGLEKRLSRWASEENLVTDSSGWSSGHGNGGHWTQSRVSPERRD
ncbi:hypothetical protein P0L94_02565 [Microbacter sp. GSS18]|nr:hypothetical protein P0L94_02565 [Microbacter sp. GSS18]